MPTIDFSPLASENTKTSPTVGSGGLAIGVLGKLKNYIKRKLTYK